MKFAIAIFIGAITAQDCVDGELTDAGGDTCEWYYLNDSSCGYWDTAEFKANE